MRINLGFVLVFASLFASVAGAKIDPANLSEAALKQLIASEASHNQNSVGYTTARIDLMGTLYLEKKNNQYVVTDVYCEADYASAGPGTVPSETILNVEHTWPQSKFNGQKGVEKADLHHLFPADAKMNSVRGNNPFGVVAEPTETLKCAKSKIGKDAQGAIVFEPPEDHRGNVARAMFYFSIRYSMSIEASEEATLRQWNKADPVDEAEMSRNDAIEKIQGNRNPFIDQPELIDAIHDF